MENYWHICTDGLTKNVIFKTRADYVFGMNSIPVCTLAHGVTMLAFCLMSNHVHFVVQGTEELSLKFIKAYRRRLSSIADVSAADICMKRIDEEEYLMQVIGYVLRNPLPAGLKVLPIFYEWSSASLYFSGGNPSIPGDRLYSTLTFKEQRQLIKSHAEIPGHFYVSPDGLIRPACYVDYEAVENLFGAPGRLLYRLSLFFPKNTPGIAGRYRMHFLPGSYFPGQNGAHFEKKGLKPGPRSRRLQTGTVC